jgi:hypothetical protein
MSLEEANEPVDIKFADFLCCCGLIHFWMKLEIQLNKIFVDFFS